MKKSTRIIVLVAVFVIAFVALIANVSYLAITGKTLLNQTDIRNSEYAKARGVTEKDIYATRGNIYSSDNELLATSTDSYKILITLTHDRNSNNYITQNQLDAYYNYNAENDTYEEKVSVESGSLAVAIENDDSSTMKVQVAEYVTDPATYAAILAPILGVDQAELQSKLDVTTYQPDPETGEKVVQIELGNAGSNLNLAKKNAIAAYNLHGVEFEKNIIRNYKYGSLAAQVIGYTENVKETVVDDDGNPVVDEDGNVEQTTTKKIQGVAGIEAAYNTELSGEDGKESYYVDSHGFKLPNGTESKQEAVDGDNVYLTINTNVQQEAEIYMQEMIERDDIDAIWAMVMDAHTGKILCMASYPTFDLNTKSGLTEGATNYNLQSPYEAGSVVKPFVYATAMDDGTYPENETYLSGAYNVNGVVIHDHERDGWGYISYNEGLIRSSNVAICNLLDKYMNEDSLRETYEKLSYWTAGDLDGIPTTAGTSSVDNSYVDYIMTGFGQSSQWTAYQLLRAYSLFANDGCIVEPYLVDYIIDPNTNEVIYKASTEKSEQIFTPETCDKIIDLMVQVVNDENKGTAVQYAMDDITVAGKSGTGQYYDESLGTYREDYYYYTIAGLAPAEDPQIVFVCGVQGQEYVNKGDFPEMVKSLIRVSLNEIHGYDEIANSGGSLEYTAMNFKNHTLDYAKSMLAQSEITPVVIGDGSTVVDQYPSGGTTITTSSHVFLKTDGSTITLPDFTGWTRKEISTYALLSGLTINCDGIGEAVSQSVEAGTTFSNARTITVTLSEASE